MIIQSKETKGQTSLIDLLGGNTKASNTKSNDLFSKLLSTFGKQTTPDEPKVVKSTDFKTIVEPKNAVLKPTDTKSSVLKELQSLLTGSDEKESAFISKELLGNLSNDQVRSLIYRAKEYLKNEITTKDPEYQTEIKTLPKTLAGLVKLAEKMGLEPQSISMSTLISNEKEVSTFPPELLTKPLLDTKALAALPSEIKEATPFEAITQLLSEIKSKEQKNAKTSEPEATAHPTVTEKSDPQPLKALLQNMDKREPAVVSTSATVPITPNTITSSESEKKVPAELTNVKKENLLTLLQGATEIHESKSESSSPVKIEADSSKVIHAPKADSIEVKSKEAQQSMRLFASELKEAVQEYKPPFTRLTMKLNPEKLGEVEVTLVQRGNNVHVNIQSNNTSSVAFLAHNATELKAQLAQHGITNATMNFMSGGENQQQSNAQNQQHQHEQRQNAFKSYESFEELTLNEEQLSALEIIIPHYA